MKKGNVLIFGLVEVSAIPYRSRDNLFYHYIGANFAV